MGQRSGPTTPVTVSATIRQPMNDHGAVTVELTETNETRYLVEYASDRIQRVLGALPADTTLPMQLTRVGGRSNVWRVNGLPGAPTTPNLRTTQQKPETN
jgi:hypothetical protein